MDRHALDQPPDRHRRLRLARILLFATQEPRRLLGFACASALIEWLTVMRLGSVLMVLVALVVAVFAGLLSQTWLEQQRRVGQGKMVERPHSAGKIVVATQSLRFGAELNAAVLKEIEWPIAAVPAGAFTSISEVLKPNERRVVLSAIEPNEPILKWKITGPGQRASLSSILDPEMKAVTIRVNDIFGVAGFVLPGDRVDVLLTRAEPQAATKKDSYTDVILQHVRVLAIDQLADDRTEKPSIAKAVTLELGTQDTQRVTLAAALGSLSLALRPAGSMVVARPKRITAATLDAAADATVAGPADTNRTGLVGITRAIVRSQYVVPVASDDE